MMIRVQALARQGFDGSWRARRKWYSGAPVTVEVLDQDDDPPDVTTVVEKEGQKIERIHAHPTQIGRKSFAELKADETLRILSDTETDGALSQAALDAAKAVASDLGGKLAARDAEIGALKAKIKELQAALETAPAQTKKGK